MKRKKIYPLVSNDSIQVEEALDKLKVSLRTLKEFKSTFQKYKGRLPEYFEGKEKSRNWEFQVDNQ